MPSRKGWVTDLTEELCVCAAAAVTRLRPAAPPERARYMVSQASRQTKKCVKKCVKNLKVCGGGGRRGGKLMELYFLYIEPTVGYTYSYRTYGITHTAISLG